MMPNIHRKIRIKHYFGIVFLCSFICCLWLGNVTFATHFPAIAQTPNINQLVQQGVEYYQIGNFTGAIDLWEKAVKKNKNPAHGVIIRENLARTYQQTGKMQKSIDNWEQVIAYYSQIGDMKMLGRAKAEQAQVYNNIGQSGKALTLLCNPSINNNCVDDSAVQIAHSSKDLEGEITALGILGDTYRLRGNYEDAVNKLKASLNLAEKLNKPDYIASISNSLGNAHNSLALFKYSRAELATESAETYAEEKKFLQEARVQDNEARNSLQKSLKLATNQNNYQREIQVLQTLIPIYYRTNDITSATSYLQQAINLLEKLPENRVRVYATINLARFLQSITKEGKLGKKFVCVQSQDSPQAETLLHRAVTIAQKIGDYRAESFAQGQLGHLYECRRQYSQAQEFTAKARLAAEQGLTAPDSLYLWEWQTGRIFKKQKNIENAIAAYEKALNTLDDIRQDILRANRDIQFDFRDTIKPIYRDLVDMKLSLESPLKTSSKSAINKNKKKNDPLDSVISTIDSLRLAELQNYFGNNCNINDFIPQELTERTDEEKEIPLVDTVIPDKQTAVISTFIFDKKTAIILSLPKQKDEYNWHEVTREELTQEVNNFRRGLQKVRDDYDPQPGQDIYKWMIEPFRTKLTGIKKLVFIHDGILRSVPMATLYDGKQFLIEKYAIATTPSLSLIDSKPLNRSNLRVLALGLTQEAKVNGILKPFEPLANVEQEIDKVIETITGKKLVDENLTRNKLEQELKQKSYSILHIATHGKFGTDPNNTFIVMGKKNKDQENNPILTFNELDRLIRQTSRNREPLEMLTLTACETAVGNNRSALGLAGIAIQAGAKTALASLWVVDDTAAALFATDFYPQLKSKSEISKADALQAVQINFLKGNIGEGNIGDRYKHPGFWSSFVLIGNWI